MEISTPQNVHGRVINVYTAEFIEHRRAKFAAIKTEILPKLNNSSKICKAPNDRIQKLTARLGLLKD